MTTSTTESESGYDNSYYDFNRFLPYSINDEPAQLLNDIKRGLAEALLSNDLCRGAVFWVKSLNTYLELRYPLSVQDRIQLGQILYELVTVPGLDHALVEVFANACIRIIKKRQILPSDAMTLQWKPVFKLIISTLYPKQRERVLIGTPQHFEAVHRLVTKARRFFPASATEEILAELLPYYNPHFLASTLVSQSFIMMFLPTRIPPPPPSDIPLPESAPPFYWVPTIFTLWQTIVRTSVWDTQFLDLLSRLIKDNVSTPQHIRLTETEVDFVFSVGLRMLELPVGGSPIKIPANHETLAAESFSRCRKDKFNSFAVFIIYSMYPHTDTEGSKHPDVLKRLTSYIQAVESFFHPSNSGRWSAGLAKLLRALSYQLLKRVREEELPTCETPQHLRLTQELRTQVVEILKPVLFLCMFGKDPVAVMTTQITFRYLVALEPNLIFPNLLERVYPALETLTETHRMLSSLGTMSSTAQFLLSRHNNHYPSGGTHILPLLHLSLQGIDINDPNKTVASLTFITNALMSMPLYDLTTSAAMQHSSQESDIDTQIRLSTSGYSEWVVGFLDRVFAMFGNLPEEHNKEGNEKNVENSLLSFVLHACETMFVQSSPDILSIVTSKILTFVKTSIIPSATKTIGYLVGTLMVANPSKTLNVFLPLCKSKILEEISYGAGTSMDTTSPASDSTLLWYSSILYNVVSLGGPVLLSYKQDIKELLQTMITTLRNKAAVKATAKVLKHVLSSLTGIHPLEDRSLPPSTRNDPTAMSRHHMLWGVTYSYDEAEIGWHVPTEEEIELAIEVVKEFVVPIVAELQALITPDCPSISQEGSPSRNGATSLVTANNFMRVLTYLKAGIEGLSTVGCEIDLNNETRNDFADQSDETDHETLDESIDNLNAASRPRNFRKRVLSAGYVCISEDAGSGQRFTGEIRDLKLAIAQLLHNTIRHFIKDRDGDVENIKILVAAATALITNRGVEKSKYDDLSRSVKFAKQVVKTVLDGKRYLRYTLVKRLYLVHLNRLRLNANNLPRLNVHNLILDDLLELSMSRFTVVRKHAQSQLIRSLRCFGGRKYKHLPLILNSLRNEPQQIGKDKLEPSTAMEIDVPDADTSKKAETTDTRNPDAMKGALYLLSNRVFLNIVLRDWTHLENFLATMALLQHEDKQSIQDLVRTVFVTWFMNFVEINFDHKVPEHLQKMVQSLIPDGSQLDNNIIRSQLEEAQIRASRNRTIYRRTLNTLVEHVLSGQLHWRFSAMTLSYVDMLLRDSDVVPVKLAEAATGCLLNDLPALRRVGLGLLTRILVVLKSRSLGVHYASRPAFGVHKANSTHPMAQLRQVKGPSELPRASPGDHPLVVKELNLDDNSNEAIQRRAADYVDMSTAGWFVWPSKIVTCSPNYSTEDDSDTVKYPYTDPTSQDAFDHIKITVQSPQFWETFTRYMSLELTQREEFNNSVARFYKSLFQMFTDSFMDFYEPLCKKLCAETQQSSQRCAAEMLAGLIRGFKHWPIQMIERTWRWVIPLLRDTLDRVTPETLNIWSRFVHFCCIRRDPRRLFPLINLILKETPFDPNNESFFAEVKKLHFKREVVQCFGYRLKPFYPGLAQLYLQNINHPFNAVRECMGSILNELSQQEFLPCFETSGHVIACYAKHRTRDQGLDECQQLPPITRDDYLTQGISTLLERLQEWKRSERDRQASSGSTNYGNACKTISVWIYRALTAHRTFGSYPYVFRLVGEFFRMLDFDDHELQASTSALLPVFASYPQPATFVNDTVKQLLSVVAGHDESLRWQVRVRVLPIVQIFFFKNLHLLSKSTEAEVMQVISDLLSDTNTEIRNGAGASLSVLVRCSQRESIQSLIDKFKTLMSVKIPKRPRKLASGTLSTEEAQKQAQLEQDYSSALLQKHSGVLIGSFLVQAFPYDIPDWMPETLTLLASAMTDPAPVSQTVRKMFAEFKRTHADSWAEDKKKFTEDQLEKLTDLLILPSYYA